MSGCLTAIYLSHRYPQARICIFERSANKNEQYWCCFKTDISNGAYQKISPFCEKIWPQYLVKFSDFERILDTEYMCFFSKTVRHNVRNLKHVEISFGEVEVKKNSIQFQSNELFFDEVFDCRGAVDRKQEQSGFQKFYGLELEIESGPQLPQIPLLMDACIEQIDGFRFLYVLPISPQRLFIEDTRYSQNPDLDEEVYQREILSWVQKNNWTLKAISHVERGVLPIPLLKQSKSTDHRKIGLAGNRFHYITGYSLGAITEQLDGMLADEPKSKSSEIQKSIFIILNRLMFWGVDSENRIKIFKFFYKLPKDTIERFYAGKLKICDLKIFFSTKPPVSIRKAIQITIQSLFE